MKYPKDDKAFIKYFEKKVEDTIKKYRLLNKKEKIIVAVSGGKDSTAVLYILKKLGYTVGGLTVNLGIGDYTDINLRNVLLFCRKHEIPISTISLKEKCGFSMADIKKRFVQNNLNANFCTICGVLKRQMINKGAREMKGDKLVTGHNLDDGVQSYMMNLLRFNLEPSARLGAKAGIKDNKNFVPRVKPLYLCLEAEVRRYSQLMNFPVYYGQCPHKKSSYRNKVARELDKYYHSDDEGKLKILDAFEKVSGNMKKYYSSDNQIGVCSVCGEPSNTDICRGCILTRKIVKINQ